MVLKAELQRMVAECACSRVAECRVIEVPADHSKKQIAGRAASGPVVALSGRGAMSVMRTDMN
jgi:hypothetical protein